MGLDMMAFVRDTAPETDVDFTGQETDIYIATWRKHPNLHGWMEKLYREKGGQNEDFNCVNLLLTEEDLNALEADVKNNCLPYTTGFFFGVSRPEDDERTLKFIEDARQAMLNDMFVYYTSWW